MRFVDPKNPEEMRREFKAEHDFVDAIAREDVNACIKAIEVLRRGTHGALRRALISVTTTASPSDHFREQMLGIYFMFGGSLRNALRNEWLFLDFLRAMLPRYGGPMRTLFRGETVV